MIELSENDAKILKEILTEYLNELKDEIRHTDDHDYKEILKSKESNIELLLKKLK